MMTEEPLISQEQLMEAVFPPDENERKKLLMDFFQSYRVRSFRSKALLGARSREVVSNITCRVFAF